MRFANRWLPLLLLALLPTLFLWKLTLAGRILVGLDAFNFFYPYHDGVAAALRAGRLPEWNPFLFGGVPLLADSQAQLFYPLAWPLLWLDAPSALTATLALHLAIAALGCFAWARHGLGLGRGGAWVAGALFALGGYLGAQVEHPNQVQAAAWLPWLLLAYDRARAAAVSSSPHAVHSTPHTPHSTPHIALGTLALALSFLAGHPQTTFISLAMVGLWALRCAARDDERTRAAVLRVQRVGVSRPIVLAAWRDFVRVNFLPLALIVAVGALLVMVQLVPTQQLSALSTRGGGLSFREAAAFSLDPRILPRALLPTFGRDEALLSEYVGWVGFVGLALAAVGAWRSPSRAARDFGLLAAGAGLFLALGGYNPAFWLLWRFVPGFDLFRAPARWLLLWALGAAVLAGAGMAAVERREERGERREVGTERQKAKGTAAILKQGRGAVGRLRGGWKGVGLVLIILGLFLVVGDWPALGVVPWWIGALAMAAVAVGLLRVWPRGARLSPAMVAAGLMVAELWLGAWGLPYAKATAPEAYSGLRPAPAHLITVQPAVGAARLLSQSGLTWDPGDLATLEQRHAGRLGAEAIYDLVVATKLKEVLAPQQPMRWGLRTADGYGGGLLPTARWVAFQEVLPLAKVVPDGRLREQLVAIPRRALLDVMGVEWFVADKVQDWWSEGLFHDLGAPRPLAAGETARWGTGRWQGDALSFVVIGEWPAAPGTVTVGGRPFDLSRAELSATRETARGTERHFLLALELPVEFAELAIAATEAWTLGGLTLVDRRLPAFQPLPADPALRVTLSGDVKVYQRADAPGRAWLVPSATSVESAEEAAALVADPAFDARAQVIVEQAGGAALPAGGLGTVRWLRDDPEAVTLEVAAPEGGWLVLADAPFPGWSATVDGETAPWLAANVINRALWLPPGDHRVEWRYRTPGLGLGLVGTAAGVVALGWFGIRAMRGGSRGS